MDSRAHRLRTAAIPVPLILALALLPLPPGAPDAPAAPAPQPPSVAPATTPAAQTPAEIIRAVRDLGDESFEARERASKLLWSAGEAAREPLKRATEGDDPEVASRAARLLANLDLGVRPDTPPEVAAAVGQFAAGDDAGKARVLDELWADVPKNRQVLRRLWTMPAKDEQRRKWFGGLSGLASVEASRLVEGESPDAAEPYLELAMSGGDDRAVRDFATFALVRSALPRLIETWKAQADTPAAGPASAMANRVLAYLYRADGDLPAAARCAAAAREQSLHDRLLYEAGEWEALAALPPARLDALGVTGLRPYCLRRAGDAAGADKLLAERAGRPPDGRTDLALDQLLSDRPESAVKELLRQGRSAAAVELLAGRLEFGEALKVAEWVETHNPGRDGARLRTTRAILLARLGRRDGPGGAAQLLQRTMADALRAGDSEAAIEVVRGDAVVGLDDTAVADAGAALDKWDAAEVRRRVFGAVTTSPEVWARCYELLRKIDGRDAAATFALVWDAQRGKLSPDQAKSLAEKLDTATIRGAVGADRPWWLEQCGNLAMDAGRFDLAEGYYRQMVDGYNSARGAVHLADLAFRRRQWNKSADLYARARAMDPDLLQSTYLMGRALIGAGKPQEGQKWVEWAAVQPLADEAKRAELADALDWHDLPAAAHEQRAITLRTGSPAARVAPGVLARESERAESAGDYRRATVLRERAVLESGDAFAGGPGANLLTAPARIHELRARALLEAGDADGAAREAGLALDLVPGDVGLTTTLVRDFNRAGRKDQGAALLQRTTAALRKAAMAYPGSPVLRDSLAKLAEATSNR